MCRHSYENSFDLVDPLKGSQGPVCGCPWTNHTWRTLHYIIDILEI